MEKQLLEAQLSEAEKSQERAKARAQENIENFLKELDNPKNTEDIYSDIYPYKTYEGDVVKVLDKYDERKSEADERLGTLKEQTKIESRNGFIQLSKKKRYEIIVKRRCDAEKILMEAHLGLRDTKELLGPALEELYETYEFHNLDKRNVNKN